jgi:hypothetical protein
MLYSLVLRPGRFVECDSHENTDHLRPGEAPMRKKQQEQQQ